MPLDRAYRPSTHRLGRDFYAPLLSEASLYRRASGYFSSKVFSVATEEHLAFFKRGRAMRIVTSEWYSLEDIRALAAAVYQRPSVRSKFRLADLDVKRLGADVSWSDWLSWLIAEDFIELRVAHLPDGATHHLYHEKIGIFSDDSGNYVAFNGSANETQSGYQGNFERVDVFASFGPEPERQRARMIEQQFQDLWNNTTAGLEVLSLYDALRLRLLRVNEPEPNPPKLTPSTAASTIAGVPSSPEVLLPAPGLRLMPHQSAAITAWAQAGGRGTLEMATGSGKTLTALSLASRLYDRMGGGLAILVVAPFIHLVDQWIHVARSFGLDPIRCAETSSSWHPELGAAAHALNAGTRPLLSIVTTATTLCSPTFQAVVRMIRRPMLLIGDEVHNYGATSTFQNLPSNATYRVGLSATPDRWMDPGGTTALRQYFGETVFRYTLADALRDDVLVPYRYYPEVVQLDHDEVETYLRLTQQLARLVGAEEDGPASEAAKRLLMRRARLIASARAKLPRLVSLLTGREGETHILVYCGDGTVEGPDGAESVRQVDEAVRLIGAKLGMRCASYTAATPPARRQELLRAFADGTLQVLVAIRCLDEGVDVPATRKAYLLASTTNPRQFIQRRGRLLRKYPGKARADIHDVFVSAPMVEYPPDAPEFPALRRLVKSQLARVQEFADLAENGPVARHALLPLRSHFQLLAEG